MTIFSFDVDADHARQNNELLKDARRLQISAVLFAWWEWVCGFIGSLVACRA